MKKALKTLAVTATLALVMVGAASAATWKGNSGRKGVFENQEQNGGNEPWNGYLTVGDIVSPSLAKCDRESDKHNFGTNGNLSCAGKWEDSKKNGDFKFAGDYSSAFTLTYTAKDKFDWTFDPNKVTGIALSDVLYPFFVAVKKGQNFEVWELGDDELLGGSIDSYFNDISHVTFFDSRPDVEPVPLPAAAWTLLAGIGGLTALRGRKKA